VLDDRLWSFNLQSGAETSVVNLDLGDVDDSCTTPGNNVLFVVGPHGRVCAIDLVDCRAVWQVDLGFEIRQPAALVPGRLIVLGVYGTIACIDPSTGVVAWTVETADRVTGAGVLLGRSVVTTSVDGRLRRHEIGAGRMLGEASLTDQVYATPCVRGVSAVVAGRAHLSVVDLRGWAVAQYDLPNALRTASPVLAGTDLIGADLTTGLVWSINAETGSFIELGRLGKRVQNWLACIDGWVIVAAEGGLLAGVGPR
jgi:outer membrane protein assembly factor BamB